MLDLGMNAATSLVGLGIMIRALCIINGMGAGTSHIHRLIIWLVAVSAFAVVLSPFYGQQDSARAMFLCVGPVWLLIDRRRTDALQFGCRRGKGSVSCGHKRRGHA